MGSLSNLFISQSYISLIHLGSNNTASSTPIELEDGLGNGVGVSVSTNKNLYVSGNIYASNLTGSTINTGSLLVTASFNNGTRNLTFTKGDATTFNVNIPDVSGSTFDTGSLVTTASFNAYTASQDFKNTTFATTSSVTALSQSLYFTDTTQSVNIASNSSSIGLLQTFSGSQYKADSASFSSRILAVTGSSINTGSFATTGSNTFTGVNIFSQSVEMVGGLNLYDNGITLGYPKQMGDPFQNIGINTSFVYGQTGKELLLSGDIMTQRGVSINNGLTVTGSLYVAPKPGMTPTPSNITASGDISASGNIYAANLTGSTIDTSSFATTGSNTFVGNQTITGTVFISSSTQNDLVVNGQVFISSSATGATTQPRLTVSGSAGSSIINRNSIRTSNTTDTSALFPAAVTVGDLVTADEIGITVDPAAFGVSGWTIGPAIYVNNPSDTYPSAIGFQNKANYTDGRVTVLTPLSASAGFTASLQDGYAWVGNSLGQNTQVATSSFGGGTSGGATTGSNTFTGNQTIEGAIVSNPTTAITKLFSQAFVSSSLQYNITASNATSQSNLVLGGAPLLATQTGSVIISGSNNILLSAARNNTLATGFSYGYVGGSGNIIATIPTLHTQSLVNPTMANNTLNGPLVLNFITSSTLAVPSINNNQILGITQIIHPSGSVALSGNIVMGNALISTANTTNLTLNSTISQNLVAGLNSITLNHNSSSIVYTGNIGGGMTVTNNYSSSVSTAVNNINVQANTFAGTSNTLLVSGSNTANRRTFRDNIVVGSTNAISSDLIGSTGGHLISTAIIGQNLIVSASGTSTTVGGGAFFGRFNDITNLYADSGKTIFAVGTGNSTSNRKTALSIDSSSVVNISGSLSVTGSSNFNGSSTFSGNMIITGSLTASSTINGLNINNGDVTGSSYYAIANAGFRYALSSGSLDNSYTRYGKDGFQIYQYQNQPYAFGVICTADQLNAYTGSQFRWGTVNSLGPIVNYMNMISASFTGSIAGGGAIPGLDYLKNGEIVQFQRGTTFDKNVYIQQGLYVSQSTGGSTPALTINGSGGTSALLVTGSCIITGSLTVNGSTITALAAGAFYSNQTQTSTANVSQSMTFNNTDIGSQGIQVSFGSQLTVTKAGTYNIQFSAQLLADTGADDVYIWLKKNGSNQSNTAGHIVLANNEEAIASWNYVVSANANDYFELVWQSTNGDAVLLQENSSGNIPAIPSVIATVTQVN